MIRDWHNDDAQLLPEIKVPSKGADRRTREIVIRRLRDALTNGAGGLPPTRIRCRV